MYSTPELFGVTKFIGNQRYLFICGMQREPDNHSRRYFSQVPWISASPTRESSNFFLTRNAEQLTCLGLGHFPDEGAEYDRRQTRG